MLKWMWTQYSPRPRDENTILPKKADWRCSSGREIKPRLGNLSNIYALVTAGGRRTEVLDWAHTHGCLCEEEDEDQKEEYSDQGLIYCDRAMRRDHGCRGVKGVAEALASKCTLLSDI